MNSSSNPTDPRGCHAHALWACFLRGCHAHALWACFENKLQQHMLMRREHGTRWTARRLGWALACGLAAVCFWPLLTIEFGQHNDYSRWSYDMESSMFGFPEGPHLIAIGRPVGALLLNLQFDLLHSIRDFTIWRFAAFGATLAADWMLARYLDRRLALPPWLAICAASCVFLLPSSQLYVSWVANFVPGTITVLLALATYALLERVGERTWREGLRHPLVLAWRLLPAAAVLFTAMCTYPPTALFVLVPTFAAVVFSPAGDWLQTRRRVLRDGGFAVVGLGAYFALTRLVMLPVLSALVPAVRRAIERNQTGMYQLAVGIDPLSWLENLRQVLAVALPGSLHPVVDDRTAMSAALAMLLILAVAAAAQWLRDASAGAGASALNGLWIGCQRMAFCAVLLVLAECPVMIAAGNREGFAPYRVVFPAAAMILIGEFALLWKLTTASRPLVPGLLVKPVPLLMLACAAGLGAVNLHRTAALSHGELTYFREQLAKADLRNAGGLIVIAKLPRAGEGVNVKSEFGHVATATPFVEGFIYALLAERGIKLGELPMGHLRPDQAGEYLVTSGTNTIVIDMNESPSASAGVASLPRAIATASGQRKERLAVNAFDGDLESGWEVSGSPQWLQIAYSRPYRLAGYTLRTGPLAARMARDWQLLGSNDGKQWTLIDKRRDEPAWSAREERSFPLPGPVEFSTYRLLVTAGYSDTVRIDECRLHHETVASRR